MATYIQIGSTVTVGSGGAATIDFTSIPATYTDLIVKLTTRSTGTAITTFSMRFNGSTAANYNYRYLQGTGSVAQSAAGTSVASAVNLVGYTNGSLSVANTFSNTEVYIPNYAGSNAKSYSVDSVEEENGVTAYSHLLAGLWALTSAITSITFTPDAGSFAQHSTASLYGIKKN
jgi:hypothetical protein